MPKFRKTIVYVLGGTGVLFAIFWLTRPAAPADYFSTGKIDGVWGKEMPIGIDLEALRQGQRQYTAYCGTCHDSTAAGYNRGFPNALESRMRAMPEGEVFHVITHGKNLMWGYQNKISAVDRWKIVAYQRALQRTEREGRKIPIAEAMVEEVEVLKQKSPRAPGAR